MSWKQRWSWVGAVLLNAALFFSFLHRGDIFLAIIIGLPILFNQVRGKGFLSGFLSGVVTFALAGIFLRLRLSDSVNLDGIGWLYLVCFLLGILVSLMLGWYAEPRKLSVWTAPTGAAIAVLLEAATLMVIPVHLGIFLKELPLMMRIVSVAGVWSASYLTWLFIISFADERTAQEAIKLKLLPKNPIRRLSSFVVIFLLLIVVSWMVGFPIEKGQTKIALIQTNSMDAEMLGHLNRLAAQKNPALVVWPELAGSVLASGGKANKLMELSQSASFVTSFADGHQPLPHNSASLFHEGKESSRYFKRKLFGAEKAEHTAGDQAVVVDFMGKKLGLNICFDSCYPSIMHDTARLGADAIALPTLDPESPNSILARLHADYTPFRAAELGVPIFRADTNAFSEIVDRNGDVVERAYIEKNQIITGEVVMKAKWTFYKQFGDWFLYLCGAFLLWRFFVNRRAAGRHGAVL